VKPALVLLAFALPAYGGNLVEADLSAPIPFCVSADAALAADDPQFDLHPDAFAQYRRYVKALCFPTAGDMGGKLCGVDVNCGDYYQRRPDPAPVSLPFSGLLLASVYWMLWRMR
jgi:hypothetical protein